MNQMNFLTKEYKDRLEIEEHFRKCFGIFIMVFAVLYVVSFGIGRIENSVQKKINIENAAIAENNRRIKQLTIDYEGKEVRIKGFSFKDHESKSSEKNAYYFEERMLDSEVYRSVTLNYLKKSSKYGEKINEFEYVLVLE
jgi:hypothetical protein